MYSRLLCPHSGFSMVCLFQDLGTEPSDRHLNI